MGGAKDEDLADGFSLRLACRYLDERDVTVVDTTCPWVSKVWTTVDKHERAEMTSLIHGKYAHEEAIATASMAETYLIIKNIQEATEVASYILNEPVRAPHTHPPTPGI